MFRQYQTDDGLATLMGTAAASVPTWDVNTVGQYLQTVGLPEIVRFVFRRESIDGAALLLLTKQSLTAIADLPLGYCLKLAAHLQILRQAYERTVEKDTNNSQTSSKPDEDDEAQHIGGDL